MRFIHAEDGETGSLRAHATTVEQDLLFWLTLVVRACARTRADRYSPCQPGLGKLGNWRSRTSFTRRGHDPPARDDRSDSSAAGQMGMGLQRQGPVPGRYSQPGRRRCAATCPPDPLRKPKPGETAHGVLELKRGADGEEGGNAC